MAGEGGGAAETCTEVSTCMYAPPQPAASTTKGRAASHLTQPIYDAAAGNVTGDLREESNEVASDGFGCVLLEKVSGRGNQLQL